MNKDKDCQTLLKMLGFLGLKGKPKNIFKNNSVNLSHVGGEWPRPQPLQTTVTRVGVASPVSFGTEKWVCGELCQCSSPSPLSLNYFSCLKPGTMA